MQNSGWPPGYVPAKVVVERVFNSSRTEEWLLAMARRESDPLPSVRLPAPSGGRRGARYLFDCTAVADWLRSHAS